MFNVLIFRVVCSDFENSVRFWVFVRFYRGSIWLVYRGSYKKDGLGHPFYLYFSIFF